MNIHCRDGKDNREETGETNDVEEKENLFLK